MGRGHAVVIGAGISGLLVARVLSETYGRVTVLDRDDLPAGPRPRRGVPQGRQIHALLARGSDALEQLFDGFGAELDAGGALRGDSQAETRWYVDGRRFHEGHAGLSVVASTRPFLEHLVRRRVEALPGVEVVGATQVLGLLSAAATVTGVRTRHTSGTEEDLPADLVVDAAGRRSRTPIWLRELGFPAPTESAVKADVVYVTQNYRYEPGMLDGMIGVAVTAYPGHPRSGIAVRQEGDTLSISLTGMFGADPGTDPETMLAFAETLAAPDIADALRSAVPLNQPLKMRYPGSTRLHYEQLKRFPAGYLVCGDAICSFNPIYGQGMTIAALEALELRRLLADGTENLGRRFFDAIKPVIGTAWGLSSAADLRFPEVEGTRPPFDGLRNRYLASYYRAAGIDPSLGAAFLRVSNMVDSPLRLVSPRIMLRVFRALRAA
ncbi:MAG: hypothetical protein QOH03_3211 [Kribbellaceae bacterium]|jgi:2-polyprenyl-6-methoxyphenol hydroxylase-like FAD-dependent oxidoreductase|nr:hypothetical protein [Kribbellaceae bacterium]